MENRKISLSVCLSLSLSFYLSVSVSLSVCLSVSPPTLPSSLLISPLPSSQNWRLVARGYFLGKGIVCGVFLAIVPIPPPPLPGIFIVG